MRARSRARVAGRTRRRRCASPRTPAQRVRHILVTPHARRVEQHELRAQARERARRHSPRLRDHLGARVASRARGRRGVSARARRRAEAPRPAARCRSRRRSTALPRAPRPAGVEHARRASAPRARGSPGRTRRPRSRVSCPRLPTRAPTPRISTTPSPAGRDSRRRMSLALRLRVEHRAALDVQDLARGTRAKAGPTARVQRLRARAR